MISGKKILVVVPARGGSKGIKLKNLAYFSGKPLIVWAAECANSLTYVDRQVVSTDHPEIMRLASKHGLSCPFVRPETLSGDRVSDAAVLKHALHMMEAIDKTRYDIILMLQPTSPIRCQSEIKQLVNLLVSSGCDSALTVSPTNLKFHPLKQLVLDGDQVRYFDPEGATVIARQQLTPTYHRNGIGYAVTRECLLEQSAVVGINCRALIIDRPVVNIDTPSDLVVPGDEEQH
jgi:CMP-N,N'-diacetyllegionaminic acid synthase